MSCQKPIYFLSNISKIHSLVRDYTSLNPVTFNLVNPLSTDIAILSWNQNSTNPSMISNLTKLYQLFLWQPDVNFSFKVLKYPCHKNFSKKSQGERYTVHVYCVSPKIQLPSVNSLKHRAFAAIV